MAYEQFAFEGDTDPYANYGSAYGEYADSYIDNDFAVSNPTSYDVGGAFGFGGGDSLLADWGDTITRSFDPADFPIFDVFTGATGATQNPMETTEDQTGSNFLSKLAAVGASYLQGGSASESEVRVSYDDAEVVEFMGIPLKYLLLGGAAIGAAVIWNK